MYLHLGWLKDDVTAAYAERNLVTVINVHSADQLTVAFDRAIAGLGVVAIFADIFIVALDTAVGTRPCAPPGASETICLKALRIVQRIPMPGTQTLLRCGKP